MSVVVVLKRNTFLLLARSAVNTQRAVNNKKVVASCQIVITSSCSSVETHLRCANLAARSLVAQNQTRDIMSQAMFLASTAPLLLGYMVPVFLHQVRLPLQL